MSDLETLVTLAFFFIVSIGVIYTITESVIFSPIRIFLATRSLFARSLLYCAYCVGFWVGCVLAVFLETPWNNGWYDGFFWGWYVMGMIALVRLFAPSFLPSAFNVEHELFARREEDVES